MPNFIAAAWKDIEEEILQGMHPELEEEYGTYLKTISETVFLREVNQAIDQNG